jgi:fructose-1,6-bisphosphatase I
MAFIAEAAGGVSSNGQKTVLEVEVDDLHQRVPFVVGEHDLVDRVEKAIQRDTN